MVSLLCYQAHVTSRRRCSILPAYCVATNTIDSMHIISSCSVGRGAINKESQPEH